MLVRIANREDPDQEQFDLSICCLSGPFRQAASVQNFKTFTCSQLAIGELMIREITAEFH